MNTIIISALSGIILMFSGFYIKNSRALTFISALMFIAIIIGGVFELNGCKMLDGRFPNMIGESLYGVSFIIGLAALAVFYLLINKDQFGKVGNHVGEYFALIFFSFTGVAVLGQFNNLVLMFLGIELMSIPMYIIAGTNKESLKSTEASVKYFLMGAFSTGILLLGITFLYGATGTFLVDNIDKFDQNFEMIYYLGWILIIFSFCFKVGAAPFHMWTPDVYAGTPTVFTSYMSTIVKGGSFLGFILVMQHFPADAEYSGYLRVLLGAIIVLTLVLGNFGAVTQKSVKKMMAYSSIAQAGFMLFVLFQVNSVSKEALFFYTIVYSVANFIIFYTIQQTKAEKYEDLIGLGKANPFLAAATSVALISLAGIPLTGGFIAKFMALSIGGANAENLVIIVIALVMAVLSMYYYFKVIIHMYFKEGHSNIKTQDGLTTALLVVGIVILIVMGIFPGILPSFLATPMW
ncbi:NADH-quinone oxidoreductase subunit N [Faecalibacter rhinopitheci]|uniref:NADH-quinone oxidoreductase subunit N n=1 Tax=Faecalibacter rhinopitheci TaxID=2779678 RepID=A0A8J7FQR4_9FLAO|nr:NADH-quinone oxidoreductase subunit N [Faecalibacter rhinopitheci]MBF0597804.1 NADH-quinone oxidoreductase subunit N [Faecalibacter rhinopitheci]